MVCISLEGGSFFLIMIFIGMLRRTLPSNEAPQSTLTAATSCYVQPEGERCSDAVERCAWEVYPRLASCDHQGGNARGASGRP